MDAVKIYLECEQHSKEQLKSDVKYLNNVINILQQENQELKKHLELPEHCNLKTIEDYKSYYEDATKEEILKDTYIDYCAYVNLAHRYAELKKQLEEKQNPLKGIFAQVNDDTLLRDCGNMNAEINEYKNQQKEFIEYLENKIKERDNDIKLLGKDIYTSKFAYQEILSKYKQIIGTDINVGTKGGKE